MKSKVELYWAGRTPKHKNNSKVGYYGVIILFLSGLSWAILSLGAGYSSVGLVVAIYLYCLWADS
jgi:hypothetical protein